MPDQTSLFKNTNFLKLFGSQILSQLTLSIANFLLINRVFTLTKSAVAVSLLWVFWGLPAVLIAPLSGFFIDKWDKRKILIATNFLQAVTIGCFLLVQDRSYHFLYVLIFMYSMLNQFYLPTESACLPWLIKPEHFPRANSLFLLTTYASFILGFGSGGVLVGLLGETTTIFALATFLLMATVCVAYLPREKKLVKLGNITDFLLEEVHEAWLFITQKGKLVTYALGFTSILQIITASLIVVLPKIGHDILHKDFFRVSTLLAGSLGLGVAAGGILFPRIARSLRKKNWIIIGFVALALSFMAFFGTRFISDQYRGFFVASALFIGGAAGAFVLIPTQTFVQENTPAKMRGKIYGLSTSLVTLSAIAPALLVAGCVDALGIAGFLFLVGVGILAIPLFLKKFGDSFINQTF